MHVSIEPLDRSSIRPHLVNFLTYAAVLCIGMLLQYGLSSWWQTPLPPGSERRISGYSLISPLVECIDSAETVALTPFKQDIERVIAEYFTPSSTSVYFRDLQNGYWFAIHPDEKYIPASMMKVATVMALLREVQDDPALLNTSYTYEDQFADNRNLDPGRHLVAGETYTLRQLMEYTLSRSDNEAHDMIKALLVERESDYLAQLHEYIGFRNRDMVPEDANQITIFNYASLFRLLFNASFLSPEWSEYAIELLLQSENIGGIRAGTPASVPIAHKYGFKNPVMRTAGYQFHQCGIVYAPAKPYLLCIMSKENPPGSQNAVNEGFAAIAAEVFQQVSSGATAGTTE